MRRLLLLGPIFAFAALGYVLAGRYVRGPERSAVELAEAACAEGRHALAAEHWERARVEQPEGTAPPLGLARCAEELGQLERARAAIDAAAALGCLGGKADFLARTESEEVALGWLEQEASARPQDPLPAYALSDYLARRGRPAEAERWRALADERARAAPVR